MDRDLHEHKRIIRKNALWLFWGQLIGRLLRTAIIIYPARILAQESWGAYERRESPEALFVYALDKIEPVFELFDPVNEQTPIRLKQTYESHMGKKLEATQNYPCMRKFVEVMSEDMLRRGVFWKES